MLRQFSKNALFLGCLIGMLLLGAASPTYAQQGGPTPSPLSPGAPQDTFRSYLPMVARPSLYDLTVDFIEMTQASQTNSNSVLLVAGRPTVARIYAHTNSSLSASGVTVSLSGTRGGAPLAGSPLTSGPGTVPVGWLRGDINTSFNFTLPASWLSGNVTLEARVDSTNVILERNESNNRLSITRAFNSVPALDLMIVPIRYHHEGDGRTYEPPSSTYLGPFLKDMFPVGAVNATRHASYYYSGDLSEFNSWVALLDEMDALKYVEAAPPSRVYYGLIPTQLAGGDSWWYGGIVGFGWVGKRAAIGLTDLSPWVNGGLTAAHEIGHNMWRLHAACGEPLPGNLDPTYPYPGGMIGQYGLKILGVNTFQVFPVTYPDVMSYCEPAWISDYNYLGLYDDQQANGAPPSSGPLTSGLWVRAGIGEGGEVTLKPFYALQGWADPQAGGGEYLAEFLDPSGKVISTQPMRVLHAEEPGIQARAISAILPLPAASFTSLRLVQDGQTVAEQSLSSLDPSAAPGQPTPALEMQPSVNGPVLQWGMPEVPAIVRYTTDGGQTWTGLGVDLLGGELAITPETLPQGNLEFQVILSGTLTNPLSLSWENAN